MIGLKADFLVRMVELQNLAANDNRFGDVDFITRNLAAVELTYTLAVFTREDGVP